MQPEAKPGDQDYWQQDTDSLTAPVAQSTPRAAADQTISWQASEAIHHEKNAMWFVGLAVATILLLAISIFAIKSWTFSALIVVMAATVVVLGSRPPKVMQYHLSVHGLQINGQSFGLHDFRAFGILQDGPLYSIVLIPHKRFMPGVNVYFPPDMGEQIVDVFGSALPMEHVEPDFIDKLSRRLRF